MSTVIETPRLLLRPFEATDAEAAFGWLGDPAVMQYLPDGPDASLDHTAHRLTTYRAHQAAYGYSPWLVLDRESERPIGDAGLVVLEDEGWINLTFRLAPGHWGRGLATEVARAWLRVAFDEHEIAAVGAFAHVENAVSQHVLAKLGFTVVRDDLVQGMPARVFRITASHYARAVPPHP